MSDPGLNKSTALLRRACPIWGPKPRHNLYKHLYNHPYNGQMRGLSA